jgi:CcmD family protein
VDKNLPYLAAAYGAWWLVITVYAVHLARELRKVKDAVEDLKVELQETGRQKTP